MKGSEGSPGWNSGLSVGTELRSLGDTLLRQVGRLTGKWHFIISQYLDLLLGLQIYCSNMQSELVTFLLEISQVSYRTTSPTNWQLYMRLSARSAFLELFFFNLFKNQLIGNIIFVDVADVLYGFPAD